MVDTLCCTGDAIDISQAEDSTFCTLGVFIPVGDRALPEACLFLIIGFYCSFFG